MWPRLAVVKCSPWCVVLLPWSKKFKTLLTYANLNYTVRLLNCNRRFILFYFSKIKILFFVYKQHGPSPKVKTLLTYANSNYTVRLLRLSIYFILLRFKVLFCLNKTRCEVLASPMVKEVQNTAYVELQ
jgi:hypothetical protein